MMSLELGKLKRKGENSGVAGRSGLGLGKEKCRGFGLGQGWVGVRAVTAFKFQWESPLGGVYRGR